MLFSMLFPFIFRSANFVIIGDFYNIIEVPLILFTYAAVIYLHLYEIFYKLSQKSCMKSIFVFLFFQYVKISFQEILSCYICTDSFLPDVVLCQRYHILYQAVLVEVAA